MAKKSINRAYSTADQQLLPHQRKKLGGGGVVISGQTAEKKEVNFARVVTTANITLSDAMTIDGVTVAVGDVVLVNGQTDETENGLYIVREDSWIRADVAIDKTLLVCIHEGTIYAETLWKCANDLAVTIGTDDVTFSQIPEPFVFPSNTLFVSPAFAGLAFPLFDSVQSALDAATAGDLIEIYPATYSEFLTIDKSINIHLHAGSVLGGNVTDSTGVAMCIGIIGGATDVKICGNGEINYNVTISGGGYVSGVIGYVSALTGTLNLEVDGVNIHGYVIGAGIVNSINFDYFDADGVNVIMRNCNADSATIFRSGAIAAPCTLKTINCNFGRMILCCSLGAAWLLSAKHCTFGTMGGIPLAYASQYGTCDFTDCVFNNGLTGFGKLFSAKTRFKNCIFFDWVTFGITSGGSTTNCNPPIFDGCTIVTGETYSVYDYGGSAEIYVYGVETNTSNKPTDSSITEVFN